MGACINVLHLSAQHAVVHRMFVRIYQFSLKCMRLSMSTAFLLQVKGPNHATTSGRPDFLQRVLDSCADTLQDAHQLLLLTMHAVFLETGIYLASQVVNY